MGVGTLYHCKKYHMLRLQGSYGAECDLCEREIKDEDSW